ncbi:Hypothetical_protein [Hexamita inflata]|uniref:Hypothetical_protein n=1 Tax=Hexamita inflata TaxID=28002 RepID=A0ABP1HWV6_9EUKA
MQIDSQQSNEKDSNMVNNSVIPDTLVNLSDYDKEMIEKYQSKIENGTLQIRHAFSPYNTDFSRFSVQKRTYLYVVPYTAFNKYSVYILTILDLQLDLILYFMIFSLFTAFFEYMIALPLQVLKTIIIHQNSMNLQVIKRIKVKNDQNE